MEIKKNYQYGGWNNCILISGGKIKLIIVTDIGPRVISFGACEGRNMLKEFTESLGSTGGKDWIPYGGHRLWHSPEASPRSYCPDNSEVDYKIVGSTVILSQKTERNTGIKKEMEITLFEENSFVEIVHRIINKNLWAIETAPWAITMMAENCRAIIPHEPFQSWDENLLPVNSVNLWSYTKMADPRFKWQDKYIQLKQDPALSSRQKIGITSKQCWIAGANKDDLMIKRFFRFPFAIYPDLGSNIEAYTDKDVIELETLGSMEVIEPGEYLEHTEYWFYFQAELGEDEESLDKQLIPLIDETENILYKTNER
ncbi:MAG: hypothetical protein PHU65_00860 [Actinomycetota bacterium]|jgi:hypothetical protein|nr:hypothetical protein [Actinomycetota bacterium]